MSTNGYKGVDVSGARVRDRPRLGWVDGVKDAMGCRGMTVKASRQRD